MAIKNITIYECDICGKKVENQFDFSRIKFPACFNGEYFFVNDVNKDLFDCCEECSQKITNSFAKNIGYWDTHNQVIVQAESTEKEVEKEVINYLEESIKEMDEYAISEEYDELEKHDCAVAAQAYRTILDYIKK